MLKHKSYTVEEAKKKLENYCAYQERCHQDVRQKLQSMHMIPEAIDQTMGHLIKHNYLNEERFSKAYVRGKLRQKYWGKNRLTLELKKRDVSKHNIKSALDEINEQEYNDIFEKLVEKRINQLKEPNKLKRKKKLVDYLLYRGWESFLVYNKVNELIP
ncbi:regulatory protein RecX [Yeosuana sp. MJ-SS3]|uniref:Regulatory protein RecX n=1 Tax=Gilvirhabdus luticola TaxID=3079858 RepID=A0ABU3U3A0_9FLAO|nr:regulatory protein RecX [Yeosuana sp. MJ-SS3]MDU8884811.1 regulatory protein RecX [Yeosuana sp. MJ-SS3]